jgi:hypothetical protein
MISESFQEKKMGGAVISRAHRSRLFDFIAEAL